MTQAINNNSSASLDTLVSQTSQGFGLARISEVPPESRSIFENRHPALLAQIVDILNVATSTNSFIGSWAVCQECPSCVVASIYKDKLFPSPWELFSNEFYATVLLPIASALDTIFSQLSAALTTMDCTLIDKILQHTETRLLVDYEHAIIKEVPQLRTDASARVRACGNQFEFELLTCQGWMQKF